MATPTELIDDNFFEIEAVDSQATPSPANPLQEQMKKNVNISQMASKATGINWPMLDVWQRQYEGVQIPRFPRSYLDMQWLSNFDLNVRDAIWKLKSEIFRQGIVIKSQFWGKCQDCDEEYEKKPPEALEEGLTAREFNKEGFECPECEGMIEPPKKEEKKHLKQLLKYVNQNNESLITVTKQCEDDLQKYDDMYLIIIKEYEITEDGKISWNVEEILRGDPALLRISSTERGQIGQYEFTCLFHRHFITTNRNEGCTDCDIKELFPVEYVATMMGDTDVEQAYISGEVIHASKYSQSLLYGYPPLLTLWFYAVTTVQMTKYMSQYYDYRRKPNGAIGIPAHTIKDAQDTYDYWYSMTQKDPHYFPIFNIPPDTKSIPQFVNFMDTLKEADYIAVRDEFRRACYRFYGVSPVIQGDMSQGSGLNSEGQQFKVTDRATQMAQSTWNTVHDSPGVFERLLKQLGIHDWRLELPNPDEDDKMAPLQRRHQKLLTAQIGRQLGLTMQLPEEGLTDETDFFISGDVPPLPELSFGQSPSTGIGSLAIPNVSDPQGRRESPAAQDEQTEESIAGENDGEAEATGGDDESPQQCIERNMRTLAERHPEWSPEKLESQAQFSCREHKTLEKALGPLDQLAGDFVQRVLGFFKNTLSLLFLDRFRNRDPTQIEITQSLVDFTQQTNDGMIQFGQQFVVGTYTLGKELVLLNPDADVQLPEVTLSGVLGTVRNIQDPDIQQVLNNISPLQKAFSGFSLDISQQLREVVADSFIRPAERSLERLIAQMETIIDTERYKLERIASSEAQRFSLMGRQRGFQQLEQEHGKAFNYIWSTVHDSRTSIICKEIERRIPVGGVSLTELEDLVVQVQRELMSPTWEPSFYLPHPSCRSRPLRVVEI